MKDTTYIVIPGLGDHRPIFDWFYRFVRLLWRSRGMRTVVCQMNWQAPETYAVRQDRLRALIAAERTQGRRVVLVGVSAGAAIGLLTFCEDTEVQNFVSVCGFTELTTSDRRNARYMKLSWYQAADAAERETETLSHSRKRRMLALIPRSDGVIDPRRERIPGARNVVMPAWGHLIGIVVGLLVYRARIVRFVTSKD